VIRTGGAPSATGVWFALFAVSFGTNVPIALLLGYRERLGLSATMVTVVFAVYAAGLVPALLLAGPASDRRGRRTLVVPFVVLAAVASLVLLGAATSLAALLVGRLLQGAVSGVVFSVGSAWLAELVGDASVASRRATVAMSLGFSLGPLSAGVIGQYLPAPTVLPYTVHLALMAGALVLGPRARETVVRRAGPGRVIDLGVPRAARPAFLAFVVPAALCVFTFPSVAISVLPLGLQQVLPGVELVTTGAVAGVTLGVGALVQPLEARLGAVRAAPLAATTGALGFALAWAATSGGLPWLLLPTAVLLGTGYGLALAAGLTATQWLADPAQRGALVSTFYALTYLGFAVPVVIAAVSPGTDFTAALAVLATVTAAIGLWLAAGPGRRLVTARRRATVRPPAQAVSPSDPR
jgi:hypothetical protein